MLPIEQHGSNGPLIVMVHWLGGSTRTWTEVSEQLAAHGFRGAAVDLPGFGEAWDERYFSVSAMSRRLMETIRTLRRDEHDAPWALAGHSMGGKLAVIVARAMEEGEEGLSNLRGLVLVSPSPPGPEPMGEGKREKTVRALGQATTDLDERRGNAAAFVDENTGKLPLLDEIRIRTVEDVIRMNPAALVAWMTTGSKVDCSESVGVLRIPTLILAGTEDKALGPETQRKLTLPHFADGRVVTLEGGGHLSPLERPWELSHRMLEFFREIGMPQRSAGATLSAGFSALIASDRTSPQTRKVLLERMNDERHADGFLNAEELLGLRALVAQVAMWGEVQLADRLNRSLAEEKHDGWRFGSLPEDGQAWRTGLRSLDAASITEFDVPFIALDGARQDDLLGRARKGELGKGFLASLTIFGGGELFDSNQMRDWFEDVRGEIAKLYVSDPRTMERMGFTGFADEAGFTQITLETQSEVEL